MNKRANAAIVFIAIIVLGWFLYPYIFSENKHPYLESINMRTDISKSENLEINFLIKNSENFGISPELEIIYDSGWSTNNRYARNNQHIPIGYISPKNLKKYSIEFSPPYVTNQKFTFEFKLYIRGILVDYGEENVYVR